MTTGSSGVEPMRPDYKREFEKERQRLAQLWDAYEAQGAALERLERQVQQHEHLLYEKEREIAAMRAVLANKGGGDLSRDVEMARAGEELKDAAAEVQLLKDNLRDQQDQYTSLFRMNQELDEELKQARAEIAERDRIISQLKVMLESKDKQLELLRSR